MASKVEFRRLLYKIAQKLSQEEIDSLVFIQDLPVAYKGKGPFTVLEQMVLQDTISESKPEKLVEVLKGINRMDLAKEAKDFFRTAKRSKKGSRSAVQSDDHEQVSRVAVAANFELTFLKIKSLLTQLDRLSETVSEASQGESEIERVRKAKKQIESAEWLLHCNSGMESDSTQSSTSTSDDEVRVLRSLARARSMDTLLEDTCARKPIQETYSWGESTRNEGVYEEVPSHNESLARARSMETILDRTRPLKVTYSRTDSTRDEAVYEEVNDMYMYGARQPTQVAITDKKKQNSCSKPPTMPKPKVRLSTIQHRGKLARAHSMDTLLKEGYDDYCEDFSSSDYTGSGTGDSGFGDAASLCRVPLKSKATTFTQTQLETSDDCYETSTSTRAGYYKSLNKETVADVAYDVPQGHYVNRK